MSKGYTWDQIRSQVRSFRSRTQAAFPFHALTTIKDFHFAATLNKVYFLSNNQNVDGTMSRHLTLYEAGYSDGNMVTATQSQLPAVDEHPYLTELSKFPLAEWTPLFTKYTTASVSTLDDDTMFASSDTGCNDSNLHPIQGIAQYQMIGNKVLFSFNGAVYLGDVGRISSLVPYYEEQHQQRVLHDPALYLLQSANQSDSPPSPHHNGMMTIEPPSPKQAPTATGGGGGPFSKQHLMRNDPKLGNDNLIAFIRNRDIWVVTPDGYEVQLTTCSSQTEDPTLSCGTVEYIMQEEFQRYTGYYWGPPDGSMNRILYLETSEEQVDVVVITKPTPGIQSSSSFHADNRTGSPVRYPRAGRSNAVSDMQMVYFDAVEQGHPTTVIRKRLWGGSLNERYPWAEYIVRFGWLPDGQSVWAQILSRDQQRTAVLRIECDQFVSAEEYRRDPKPTQFEVLWEEHSDVWINVSDGYYFLQHPSMDDCTEFIWSSEMSGFRHLYFVRRRRKRSGNNNNSPKESNNPSEKGEEEEEELQQLTYGEDWGLTDQSIDVDERRKLVYFKAKKDTPLETHFYAVSYQQQQSIINGNNGNNKHNPIIRLTELGFSHNVTIDTNADAFVDCFSSLHHTPCIVIRGIEYHYHNNGEDGDFILPAVSETRATLLIPLARCGNEETDPSSVDGNIAAATSGGSGGAIAGSFENSSSSRRLSSPQQQMVYVSPTVLESSNTSSNANLQYCKSDGIEYLHDTMKSSTIESFDTETQTVPAGEIFSFVNQDGVRLYGCLYKPRFYQPGASYPTILYIYGGPKTQMVINDFRLPRLQRYLMSVYFGFAVVVIDGRGSSDRGIQFEAHLKHRLGSVEMDDQIAGLQYICDAKIGAEATPDGKLVSVVDINRVAINGWSYGGYLSLMGLAQRPDIFKIAIAGAPVTQWELYDSAYTERYMGTPMTNPAGYQSGSVVNWAKQFPDGEHRLLIAHGLIDENVHFTNTEMLVSKLVKYNKPHYLQVYPTERHGLRHASVNEHFETLMFFWLINYL